MWFLTEIDRKIVEGLRDGMTPDEVAKSLGMKRNTLYSHLFKMRKKYAECKQLVHAIDELKQDPNVYPYLRIGKMKK